MAVSVIDVPDGRSVVLVGSVVTVPPVVGSMVRVYVVGSVVPTIDILFQVYPPQVLPTGAGNTFTPNVKSALVVGTY